MSRPLRIELAGGLYHVTSRGNCRDDIFSDDGDRRLWLEVFGAVCHRCQWLCHAWCQMDNHYHIVVETLEANLAQGMRQLNGVYTQSFNRRHRQVGHLFQGRYRAIVVEKETHLVELARHVVLNPVRAGLVDEAGAWPWSSHRAMSGAETPPDWLHVDWLRKRFGRTRRRAMTAYAGFVLAGCGGETGRPWEALKGQIFLGSDDFVRRMRELIKGRDGEREFPVVQRRPVALPLSEYRNASPDPQAGMAAAYETGRYTMREIAACFGVHYATVSRAIKRKERTN